MRGHSFLSRVRAVPMLILLVPVVAFILLCYYTGHPLNLLQDTEFEAIDSLRSYCFVLESEAQPTEHCYRYEAVILSRQGSEAGRVLLYVLRDSTRAVPAEGDTIIARTRIKRGESFGRFDYGAYLRRNGIIGTAYVHRYGYSPSHVRVPPDLQHRLYQRLVQSGMHGDPLAATAALTLGYKEDLDPQLQNRFRAAGAAHILAVSGLHTGIIYALLVALLTVGGRYKPMHENRIGRCALSLTIIAVMWVYAYITALTPSVVRAVVMVTLVETGRMLYSKSLSINTIAAAAVLLLLVRPLDLWSLSFQLSFAATAAIVLCAGKTEKYLSRIAGSDALKDRLVRWVAGTIIISVAAWIGTAPITMYTFGVSSNYFLLANLIVLPLATLLVPCGMAAIVLGGSHAGVIAGYAAQITAWLMNQAVGLIEALPYSTTQAYVSLPMVAVYYVMLFLFVTLLHAK